MTGMNQYFVENVTVKGIAPRCCHTHSRDLIAGSSEKIGKAGRTSVRINPGSLCDETLCGIQSLGVARARVITLKFTHSCFVELRLVFGELFSPR